MGLFSWLFGKSDEDLIRMAMDDTWVPILCREEAMQLLNEWKADPEGLEFIVYVREWKIKQRWKPQTDDNHCCRPVRPPEKKEEDCYGGGCACDEADAAIVAETVADVVQTVAASLPESAPIQSEPVSHTPEPTPAPSYSAPDPTPSAASSWSSDSGSSGYSSSDYDSSSSSWSSDSGSSSSDCGGGGCGGD